MWKILFVVVFTCYFIVKDTFFWKCPSFLGKLIFIMHHMITTAALFSGPLFGFYYFHIFVLLSTMASWIFLKKCFVSMYHNYLCGNKGEMFQNYQKGIEQIDGFDLISNLYIKKYYRNYSIERSIILSNGESNSLKDKVLFQLNSNGKILYSNRLPSKIAQYINENHN